jgi:Cellulose biosynthesis protein BcsS
MRGLQGERWGSATPFVLLQSALTVLCLIACSVVRAAEPATDPEFGWREMWIGADASADVWLIYTGVTLAPYSKDIYSDGVRLRMSSGYGKYSYQTTSKNVEVQKICKAEHFKSPVCFADVEVGISYVDALAGYQMRFGELTAKVFAGASMVSHEHSIEPLGEATTGRKFGPTGAVELWLNLGDQAWTSLDLSYTTAHETGSARWRAGWRALPTLSIGPELRFDRNSQSGSVRAGGFARYEWLGGEISAAGGVAQRYCDSENESSCDRNPDTNQNSDIDAYATLNFLTQF